MRSPDAPPPAGHPEDSWHRKLLEGRAGLFAAVTTVGISIGGIVEIVPMYTIAAGPEHIESVQPYTPLELAGRDIYAREGCVQCHSQMVRPFRAETLRYGTWSRAGEYAFDRPFLLGSRRIGPDLHRVGGKYPNAWHYEHMRDPRATSPGSIMPPYSWLHRDSYDMADIQASVQAMATLGVPYAAADLADVGPSVRAQAQAIVDDLATAGITTTPDKEIIALTAYLQRLGTDAKATLTARDAASAAAAPPPASTVQ
jgi:cytochrome c oxidase cbb3-type subunit I/II